MKDKISKSFSLQDGRNLFSINNIYKYSFIYGGICCMIGIKEKVCRKNLQDSQLAGGRTFIGEDSYGLHQEIFL